MCGKMKNEKLTLINAYNIITHKLDGVFVMLPENYTYAELEVLVKAINKDLTIHHSCRS